MHLLLIFLLFTVGSVFAQEQPPRPFEPFDAGREYTVYDVERTRELTYPDDPFLLKQWHLENKGQPDDKDQPGIAGADINMRPAWDIWNPKEEIILAVLDSGIDLEHEDICPSILWVNPGESGLDEFGNDKATNGIDDDGNGYVDDVHGYNFVADTPNIQEDRYHGTHCSSIISATFNNSVGVAGMNPKIKIMHVKIFGLGSTLYSKDIARAVRYAVDNGAKVLSNSYGTPSYTTHMHEAVRYAHEHGALFVCASGNSRKNMDNEESKDYPSCYNVPNQLVVGATDNRDRSTFSNYGSMVEIAAPGANIFSLMPKNKYRAFSGSSQACPQVAAAAAMVWSQNPEWNYQQVKDALLYSADEIPGLSRYVTNGLRLNVTNALTGKQGRRLPKHDFTSWQNEERVIESSHPYYNNKTERHKVVVHGASRFRLHFSQIEVNHHGDWLEIFVPGQDEPIEIINGIFENSWSEVIEGDRAELILSANEYVNGYGFKVDRIQWQK